MKQLIKKYEKFIKYVFSSGICIIIDLSFFTLCNYLLRNQLGDKSIVVATWIARVISSIVNCLLNGHLVFKENKNDKINYKMIIKYFILVIIQLNVSSYSVLYLYRKIGINETIIKLVVDVLIFFVNFFVQKIFIFNQKHYGGHDEKSIK